MTDKDSEHDQELSALYRKIPQDRSPTALDLRVMEIARSANAPAARPRWLLPASLAASVTLAVGVAYKVADNTPLMSPEAEDSFVVKDSLEPALTASDYQTSVTIDSDLGTSLDSRVTEFEADERVSRATSPNENRNAAPLPSPGAALSEATEEINDAAEAIARQARQTRVDQNNQQLGRSAEESILAETEQPAALSALRGESRRMAKSVSSSTSPCAEHVDDADLWAICIRDLRDTGESALAAAELKLWETAFPDETFPER